MILLDSDVAIDVLRGLPPAINWFSARPQDEVVIIPGYVAMELIWGTRDTQDQRETERWLSQFQIAWIEPTQCQQAYQTLNAVHLRNAIDTLDMLIAYVAISLDLPLYTFNQKHFDVVPGLKTIRPYTR